MQSTRKTARNLAMLAGMSAAMTAVMSAQAEMPDVMDFVPSDTPIVVTIPNLKETHTRAIAWAEQLDQPELQQSLLFGNVLMANPGLNAEGSAAILFTEMFDPESGEEPPVVILLPIVDFAQMVTGLAGEVGEGVTEIATPFGATIFAKPAGENFAVVGIDGELVEAFAADDGHMNSQATLLGSTGEAVVGDSHMMVIANVEQLRPALEEGLASLMEGMEMMAMFAGGAPGGMEQMEASMEFIETIATGFVTDGNVGLIGLELGDDGLALDIAAQFREGSEVAGFFQDGGEPNKLMSKLPAGDFLFAGAADIESPGLRQLFTNYMEMAGDAAMGGMAGIDIGAAFDDANGFSFMMGSTPALLTAGLFSNTISYAAVDDVDEYMDSIKTAFEEMDGVTVSGLKNSVSYDAAATEVDGVSLDAWSMEMSVDQNDPNAPMAQMALSQMAMVFGGQAGPSGYYAKANDGIYQTMSRNKQLIGNAMSGEDTLGESDAIQAVASQLPANRSIEAYVGVQGIMDTLGGMVAMFGGPALPAPEEDLLPVGLATVTDQGGVRQRIFVPTEVIETAIEIAQDLEEMDAGGGGGFAPRF
ncbi:MAG: hypothetical protein AAF747_02705 [Planctomycetota bacterium]